MTTKPKPVLKIKQLEFWWYDRKKLIWVRSRTGKTHLVAPTGVSLCGKPRRLANFEKHWAGNHWGSPPEPGNVTCEKCLYINCEHYCRSKAGHRLWRDYNLAQKGY